MRGVSRSRLALGFVILRTPFSTGLPAPFWPGTFLVRRRMATSHQLSNLIISHMDAARSASRGRVTGSGGIPWRAGTDMPVVTGLGACARPPATSAYRRAITTLRCSMGNYLDKNSRSLRRRERRPSYMHTAAPVLGPRAVTPGVAATTGPSVDVSSTASVAAPTGRVPGLRGAFIIASTPCALVLVYWGPT